MLARSGRSRPDRPYRSRRLRPPDHRPAEAFAGASARRRAPPRRGSTRVREVVGHQRARGIAEGRSHGLLTPAAEAVEAALACVVQGMTHAQRNSCASAARPRAPDRYRRWPPGRPTDHPGVGSTGSRRPPHEVEVAQASRALLELRLGAVTGAAVRAPQAVAHGKPVVEAGSRAHGAQQLGMEAARQGLAPGDQTAIQQRRSRLWVQLGAIIQHAKGITHLEIRVDREDVHDQEEHAPDDGSEVGVVLPGGNEGDVNIGPGAELAPAISPVARMAISIPVGGTSARLRGWPVGTAGGSRHRKLGERQTVRPARGRRAKGVAARPARRRCAPPARANPHTIKGGGLVPFAIFPREPGDVRCRTAMPRPA